MQYLRCPCVGPPTARLFSTSSDEHAALEERVVGEEVLQFSRSRAVEDPHLGITVWAGPGEDVCAAVAIEVQRSDIVLPTKRLSLFSSEWVGKFASSCSEDSHTLRGCGARRGDPRSLDVAWTTMCSRPSLLLRLPHRQGPALGSWRRLLERACALPTKAGRGRPTARPGSDRAAGPWRWPPAAPPRRRPRSTRRGGAGWAACVSTRVVKEPMRGVQAPLSAGTSSGERRGLTRWPPPFAATTMPA